MAEMNEEPRPKNSVVSALKAGFDLTTKRWWLLIIPVLVDTFLWLGPRLRVWEPVQAFYDELLAVAPNDSFLLDGEQIEFFYQMLEGTNLFVTMSVPIFGIPVLMSGMTREKVPLESAEVLLGSVGEIAGYFLLFLLVGLAISAVYFAMIVTEVDDERTMRDFIVELPVNIVRMIILGLVVYIGIGLLIFSLAFVAALAGTVFIALAPIVMIGGSIFVIWAVIFASFGPHALLMQGLTPFQALRQSVSFIRGRIGLVLPLLLIIWVTSSYINSLWLLADNGTWLTFVSIAGHAFVATSLMTATFIFYKEQALTLATTR